MPGPRAKPGHHSADLAGAATIRACFPHRTAARLDGRRRVRDGPGPFGVARLGPDLGSVSDRARPNDIAGSGAEDAALPGSRLAEARAKDGSRPRPAQRPCRPISPGRLPGPPVGDPSPGTPSSLRRYGRAPFRPIDRERRSAAHEPGSARRPPERLCTRGCGSAERFAAERDATPPPVRRGRRGPRRAAGPVARAPADRLRAGFGPLRGVGRCEDPVDRPGRRRPPPAPRERRAGKLRALAGPPEPRGKQPIRPGPSHGRPRGRARPSGAGRRDRPNRSAGDRPAGRSEARVREAGRERRRSCANSRRQGRRASGSCREGPSRYAPAAAAHHPRTTPGVCRLLSAVRARARPAG